MTRWRLDGDHSTIGSSVRRMTSRLPGRRRRRQPTALLAGFVIAGLVAMAVVIAGLAALRVRRRAASGMVPGHTPGDAAFDAAALDRASGEGMAPAPATDVGDAPATSNGTVPEPVTNGGLVRLV